jgi:hypothetical protein
MILGSLLKGFLICNWRYALGILYVTGGDAYIDASAVELYLQNYGNLVIEVPGDIDVWQDIESSLNSFQTLTFKCNGHFLLNGVAIGNVNITGYAGGSNSSGNGDYGVTSQV